MDGASRPPSRRTTSSRGIVSMSARVRASDYTAATWDARPHRVTSR
jgi:hypothetical protein